MDKEIGFKNDLKLIKSIVCDGVQHYELAEDLIFFNGKDNIIVRKNWNGDIFVTDLATTPRFLKWLLPSDKKLYKRASVLHDYLYSQRAISRKFADDMFLLAIRSEMRDILVEVGNPRTKLFRRIRYTLIAYSFYFMVRLFGESFRV